MKGTSGLLLREQRKVPATQREVRKPEGLSVVSEKINLRNCVRPYNASLFSRSGWATDELRGKIMGFQSRQI